MQDVECRMQDVGLHAALASTLCILHSASCILHPAFCILHSASCILHPTFRRPDGGTRVACPQS
jgi:hypothetical protein